MDLYVLIPPLRSRGTSVDLHILAEIFVGFDPVLKMSKTFRPSVGFLLCFWQSRVLRIVSLNQTKTAALAMILQMLTGSFCAMPAKHWEK